ncbi:MAG: DUF116 domain-containing protein [Lentisphaeria bacterium]
MISKFLIRINNFLTRIRRVRVAPENLLVLAPHCLQWSDCQQNIVRDISNCKHCGKCPIKDLYELTNKYGIRGLVASGGRQASAAVHQKDVKAVVAVACNKELAAGVLVAFPTPVLTVSNKQPCGFCHNTTVDVREVETAIKSLLRSK